MNIKKVVAREGLILIIPIVIALFGFLYGYIYITFYVHLEINPLQLLRVWILRVAIPLYFVYVPIRLSILAIGILKGK